MSGANDKVAKASCRKKLFIYIATCFLALLVCAFAINFYQEFRWSQKHKEYFKKYIAEVILWNLISYDNLGWKDELVKVGFQPISTNRFFEFKRTSLGNVELLSFKEKNGTDKPPQLDLGSVRFQIFLPSGQLQYSYDLRWDEENAIGRIRRTNTAKNLVEEVSLESFKKCISFDTALRKEMEKSEVRNP